MPPFEPPQLEPTAVSPTGKAVLSPRVVPWLIGVCTLAAAGVATFPEHTWAYRISAAVAGLCALGGMASPGLRRPS